MTREEKFNVAVAAFEAFLKKGNAHTSYFQEWEKRKDYHGTANVFYAWREWAKSEKPSSWIIGAFVWRETDRGRTYWSTLHLAWKRYLKDNLNK